MPLYVAASGNIDFGSGDVQIKHEHGQVRVEGGYLCVSGSTSADNRLGVATKVPIAELDVYGPIAITKTITTPATGTTGQGHIYQKSDGNLYWQSKLITEVNLSSPVMDADGDTRIYVEQSADEDKIRFNTAGAERMIITDAGEVGIGITPTEKLHVDGNAIVTGDLTVDTNTLHVDSTQNRVGIGTTSPNTHQLEIHGGDWDTLLKLKAVGANSGLSFEDSDGNEDAHFMANADGLKIITGTSDVRMLVGSSGHVGIGVTDPDAKLEVSGAIHISAELDSAIPAAPSNGDGGIIFTKADGKPYWVSSEVSTPVDLTATGGTATLIADADNNTKVQVEESADENQIRFDTAGSERMIIDNVGNVGIGVTDPDAKLEVSGAIHISAELDGAIPAAPSNGDGGIIFTKADGKPYWVSSEVSTPVDLTTVGGTATLIADADNNTKVQVEEAADENKIRFDTAGSERMIIDEAGLVGIGISVPTKLLHISSADRDNPHVLLESTEDHNSNKGSVVQFTKTRTGVANDVLGRIQFFGKDASGNAEEQFASIYSQIEDPAHGSENGLLAFRVANNGADECPLLVKSGKVVIGPNITVPTKTVNATLDIEDDVTDTGDVVSISADALTDGRALFIESTSNSANTRVLGRISNTNALAINATPLSINQDAVITATNDPGIPLMDFEAGANASVMALKYKEIETGNMTGTSTDVTGFIPQYAIPIALGVKVSVNLVDGGTAREITKIGSINDDDSFMATTGGSAVTLSTTSHSVVLPYVPATAESQQDGGAIFNQATADLKITHTNLTAGKVKVCLWYYKITPPT